MPRVKKADINEYCLKQFMLSRSIDRSLTGSTRQKSRSWLRLRDRMRIVAESSESFTFSEKPAMRS